MTSYTDKADSRFKKAAEEAFAELKDTAEAERVHTQLLAWLQRVGNIFADPAEAFTDEHADLACNVLTRVLTEMAKEGRDDVKPMLKSLDRLGDDTALDLMRNFLGVLVRSMTTSSVLVSRDTYGLWEQTAFHIDGAIQGAFAKIGGNQRREEKERDSGGDKQPYQLIGFDNGTAHIPTEGSKLLWLRDFGIALILPFQPAFTVNPEDIPRSWAVISDVLSQSEREKIQKVIELFEEDLHNHGIAENDDERREMEEKMRLSIDLARVQLPRLDEHMNQIAEQTPSVGERFENVEVVQLTVSCSEFLRLVLDEDKVRSAINHTGLYLGDERNNRIALLEGGIKDLKRALPTEGDIPDDLGAVTAVLSCISVAVPEVNQLMKTLEGETTVVEGAREVLKTLEHMLEELHDTK